MIPSCVIRQWESIKIHVCHIYLENSVGYQMCIHRMKKIYLWQNLMVYLYIKSFTTHSLGFPGMTNLNWFLIFIQYIGAEYFMQIRMWPI